MKTAVVLLLLVAFSYAYVVKKEEKPLLGGALCDICKDLVAGAESAGEGAGEAYLKEEIHKLCQSLHAGFLDTVCETILDGLVGELGELINQGLPPAVACKDIDLC